MWSLASSRYLINICGRQADRKSEEARDGIAITSAGRKHIQLPWAGFARLGKEKGLLGQGDLETDRSEIIGEFIVCLTVSEKASLAGVDNCVRMSSRRYVSESILDLSH